MIVIVFLSDINECKEACGICQDYCTNNIGSYRHNDHYYYMIMNVLLADINECQEDCCLCQHNCTNTIGSY